MRVRAREPTPVMPSSFAVTGRPVGFARRCAELRRRLANVAAAEPDGDVFEIALEAFA